MCRAVLHLSGFSALLLLLLFTRHFFFFFARFVSLDFCQRHTRTTHIFSHAVISRFTFISANTAAAHFDCMCVNITQEAASGSSRSDTSRPTVHFTIFVHFCSKSVLCTALAYTCVCVFTSSSVCVEIFLPNRSPWSSGRV